MAGPGHFAACALVSAAALVAGALVGRRAAADPRRSAWVLGPCVLLLVFYALLRWLPQWEVRLFPWGFYAFYERQWAFPPGIFVLACGGAMLPVRWNRWFVWAAAAGLLGWSACAGRWMLQPLCPGSRDLPVRGMMVEQSTGYTCAPAACETLLAAWGIDKSEHEMAQLCLCVPDRGTTAFDTYRGIRLAAEGSGLKARFVAPDRGELAHLVCPFTIGRGGHALVIFAVRGGQFLVGDPLQERPQWRSAVSVLADWDGCAALLCREGPYDGANAPHLQAWLDNAKSASLAKPHRPKYLTGPDGAGDPIEQRERESAARALEELREERSRRRADE
jgi:hypothetical protein